MHPLHLQDIFKYYTKRDRNRFHTLKYILEYNIMSRFLYSKGYNIMKKCKKCLQDKQEHEFNKRSRNIDGLDHKCKICARTRAKKLYDLDKPKNRKRIYKYRKKIVKPMKDFVLSIRSLGCSLCNESDPCCIDFHHVNNKTDDISRIIKHLSFNKLVNEINKCILLCSNCHKKVHRHNIDISHIPLLSIKRHK